MIKLTLTEDEAEVVVNSLRHQLESVEFWKPEYDFLSVTYHTVYDMVRQQRKANA